MQLLVSVRSASEVDAALAGGADIIDAKEPSAGALGAVALPTFRAICAAVRCRALVSAALGDIVDPGEAETLARTYASAGASFVKIGFSGTTDPSRVLQIIARASGAASCPVVAVAYADASLVGAINPRALLDCAARAGARGVLLDTVSKSGARLRELVTDAWLRTWVTDAHRAGLYAAVAGKLNEGDVPFAHDAGADIMGVRGAVCDGGRLGVVSTERVRQLRNRIDDAEFKRAETSARALSGAS